MSSREALIDVSAHQPLKPMEGILAGEGGFTTVFISENDPNTVVKQIDTLWWMQQGYDARYRLNEFMEFVAPTVEIFRDSQYGLSEFVPPVELAWGDDSTGKERGFIIMPRVKGTEILDTQRIDGRTAGLIDDLITAAVAIDINTAGTYRDRRIRPDIIRNIEGHYRIQNIMLGTLPGKSVSQPWLVDVYPGYYFTQFPSMLVGKQGWYEALSELRARSGNYGYTQSLSAVDKLFQNYPLAA